MSTVSTDPTAIAAARLIQCGTATLHEAQGRRGLTSGIRLMSGSGFAGRARTTMLPAGDNLALHAALRESLPGTVLCVGSGGGGLYGVLGDLLALAVVECGLAGIVIDDAVRDVAQLGGAPVAARGISSLGTQKRRILSLGEPIAVGRVLVRPGDWVVCDADGVCVVPAEALSRVLAAATARVEKEDTIRARLRAGQSTVEAIGLDDLIDRAVPNIGNS